MGFEGRVAEESSLDDETGLYHMGARYYAAWLGRWTSADPLGIGADGPGLYNYTRGSPVTMVDPSGTEGETPDQSSGDFLIDVFASGVMGGLQYFLGCSPTQPDAGTTSSSTATVNGPPTSTPSATASAIVSSSVSARIRPKERTVADAFAAGVAAEEAGNSVERRAAAQEVGLGLASATYTDGKQSKSLFDHNHAEAATHIATIVDAAWAAGVTDRAQIAYMLATADHESELGSDMHEDKPNALTSSKYRGRGYVQVTELKKNTEIVDGVEVPKKNSQYRKYADATGHDIVSNPALAEDPEVAADILVVGLTEKGKTFRGSKTLSDYNVFETATPKELGYAFYQARRIVQAGLSTEREQQIAHTVKRQATRVFERLR